MRILITGSRNWDSPGTIQKAIEEQTRGLEPHVVTLVHGDCPTGADALADEYARAQGFHVEKYPADWTQGRKAGPLRNKKMVDLGADICLAFPKGKSAGTRGCMKLALEAGINTKVFPG